MSEKDLYVAAIVRYLIDALGDSRPRSKTPWDQWATATAQSNRDDARNFFLRTQRYRGDNGEWRDTMLLTAGIDPFKITDWARETDANGWKNGWDTLKAVPGTRVIQARTSA